MTLSDLALTITCTYCGAQPDQPCRTGVSGARVAMLHKARLQPMRAAWLNGFEAAVDCAIAEYEETQR